MCSELGHLSSEDAVRYGPADDVPEVFSPASTGCQGSKPVYKAERGFDELWSSSMR